MRSPGELCVQGGKAMEKKRLEYMDMAKGAGIIGIVIMHSSTMPDRVVG